MIDILGACKVVTWAKNNTITVNFFKHLSTFGNATRTSFEVLKVKGIY